MRGPCRKFRILWALLCLLPASAPVLGARNGEDVESVIARVWLERASDLLDDAGGDSDVLEEARKAWSSAGEYAAGNPDYLYIEAQLLLSGASMGLADDSTIRTAYRRLTLCLDRTGQDEFGISDFRSRAVFWSALALRLREYRALIDRYDDWPRGEKNDPVLIYAAARASLYLGLDRKAGELASKGEALAGSDTDLGELGVGFGTPLPAFRALAMAAGVDGAFEGVEAAARRWTGMSDALLPWVMAGYFDAREVPALKSVMNATLHPVIELLAGGRGSSSGASHISAGRDLVLAAKTGVDPTDEYGSFTGALSADVNYDGYPEEWIKLVNGRPSSRKIDADQDGRYEWEFEFEDNSPLMIRIDEGRLVFHYERDSFPEILSMVAKQGDTTTVVSFYPGAFSWDPTDGNPVWGVPEAPDWERPLFWEAARSVTVDASMEEGTVRAVTALSGGYPVRAEESGYLKGDPAIPLWVRQILYDDGAPVAGRQSFRTAPDDPEKRIWELYERYECGRMVGLAWDPGMTGTPMYMRDWALERYFEIQAWNLDGDEWMDARRFLLPDGSESSSELLITEARTEDLLPWTASDWAPWDR